MINRSNLYVACSTNDVELLERFVAEHPERENYVVLDERYSRMPPFCCAIENDSCQIVDHLLKKKLVDVLQHYDDGGLANYDCLALAMRSGRTSSDMIKLLIENDESFQLADKYFLHGAFFSAEFNDKFETMVESLQARNYKIPKPRSFYELSQRIITNSGPEKLRYFLQSENLQFLTGGDKQRTKELLKTFCADILTQRFYFKRELESMDPSEWIDIFDKLFSLMIETCVDSFVDNLPMLMSLMCVYDLNEWIDRCIKT